MDIERDEGAGRHKICPYRLLRNPDLDFALKRVKNWQPVWSRNGPARHEMREWAEVRSTRIARLVWLTLVVVGTVLFFAGPISQWGALRTACHPEAACRQFQLNPAAVHTLGAYGISSTTYAVFSLAVLALVWALWYGLSALIVRRRADDRGALLAAYFLAAFPIFELDGWLSSDSASAWLGNIFVPMLLIFVLLFPDGQFAPGWTRWLAVGVVVYFVATSQPASGLLSGLELVGLLLVFLAVIGAQIYRYRVISTGGQREQIKWAVVGLAVALLGLAALWFIIPIAPFDTKQGSLYIAFTTSVGTAVVVSSVPMAIAVAVLRNHLWDIDRIISRALAYTVLTVMLAAVYAASVIGMQTLSRGLVGRSSDIAIALSTLIIAALFGPLRRRVQTVIDRRFYRSRYDAERIMSSLGEQLRDQVDLGQLSDELGLAIHETLHPAHLALWIRD
jgi:hypothetical protein